MSLCISHVLFVHDLGIDFPNINIRKHNLILFIQVELASLYVQCIHLNVDLSHEQLLREILDWSASPNEHHQSALFHEVDRIVRGVEAWKVTVLPYFLDLGCVRIHPDFL